MSMIFSLLGLVCSLGALVCLIYIIVRMFQKAGALQGILGIVCSIWAFIWGWMNAKDEKFQGIPVMITWTGFIVGGMLLNFLAGMFAGN